MVTKYEESLKWLYSFERYGRKLGLERISYLLERLGNPHLDLKVIHVAGSNGKGSVCNFLGSILQKSGYKVGVYTSPHLQRFSERILINNREISKENIASLVQKIESIVKEMERDVPTFFEIVTAMAFQYFFDKKVDFAVIEVGLGGRFDATNVVTPLISVITDISLEHCQELGKTLESIAFEKGGIIKENAPVVTSAKGIPRRVIKKIAEEKGVDALTICKWKRIFHSLECQRFRIGDYVLETSLQGEHQGENIALAIACIQELQKMGFPIHNVEEGIRSAFIPGRMEIVSRNPTILLDGAHNPAGMRVLRRALEKDFKYENLILVIGILRDKDIEKMLSIIEPLPDIFIPTKSKNTRAASPFFLAERIKKDKIIEESIPKAIERAKTIAKKRDLICITGSLFTVGEARSYLL
jgi:dihydrofolate synthase/folylpolyglutamate synthase